MGHFVNLFEYTLMKDTKLAEIQKRIPQNANYTSLNIQNDLINEMASMVTENVSIEVQSCDLKMFTLLADGTKNESGFENISVSLRYIKNGKSFESLLKMPKADKLDAQSLCMLLLNTLRDSGLDPSQILSQCYDGANVMNDNQGGVQKILQDSLKTQISYVHCYNHKLHLVVIDLLKEVPKLKQFFDKLCLLYTFFSKFKVGFVYQGARLK